MIRVDGTHIVALFFFNDTATTEIYTLSLHDALPISAVVGHLSSTGVDVTLTGIDADGDNTTAFSISVSPSHGSLGSIGSIGCGSTTPRTCTATVHYTPNSPTGDFTGTDTFKYKASDGTLGP